MTEYFPRCEIEDQNMTMKLENTGTSPNIISTMIICGTCGIKCG